MLRQCTLGLLRRRVAATSGAPGVAAPLLVQGHQQQPAGSSSSNSSTPLPLQLCWLHSPAGLPASPTHAYHHNGRGRGDGSGGSSSEDSDGSSTTSSNERATTSTSSGRSSRAGSRTRSARGSRGAAGALGGSSAEPPTAQLQELRLSLRKLQQRQRQAAQAAAGIADGDVDDAEQEALHMREALQLPEYVAHRAMTDPLSVLMGSQGIPLGISLKVSTDRLERGSDADADRRDWQGLIGRGSSTASVLRARQQPRLQQLSAATDSEDDDASSSSSSSEQDASTSLPELDAQRLRQKHLRATWSLLAEEHFRKTRAAAAAEVAAESAAAAPAGLPPLATADADADAADEAEDEAEEGAVGAAAGGSSTTSSSVVGQRVREQLSSLFAPADSDSWGTTQQSPADIARRIADSNRAAAGGGGGDEDEGGSEDDDASDDEDEPLPGDGRYADPASIAADLKEMDEIFEVLAKVPWLDDGDVDERQLRGLVAVGLLGTLEEVGWQLRPHLAALWRGERDAEALTRGVAPREAAALTAVLFHMQQLEGEFGPPAPAGVAAAVAALEEAAAGTGGDGGGGEEQQGGGGSA